MEGEVDSFIQSVVMSKQENISNNTRKKRTGLKLSLFNVSFHYDLSFLLRVPHLNNTFSESDRPTPPLPRLVVYTHVFQLGNYVSCMLNIAISFFFSRLRHVHLARSRCDRKYILCGISQTSYSNQRSMTQ